MAKLKAPLLSLGAAGALGKAMVFFGWKGIDCVREYVIPSNPKTALQTTQRGYLTAAVAKIHAVQATSPNGLVEEDQTAYALLGSTFPTPRTWFNQIVKLWCDVKVDSKVPVIYSTFNLPDKDRASLDVIAFLNEETGSQLAAGKFYFGTRKTNLVHPVTANVVAGDNVNAANQDLSGWMAVGVKYFVQFRPDAGDPCEGANSGILSFVAE